MQERRNYISNPLELRLSSTPLSCINSSPPSAAYMCRRSELALVQVKACRLFGAKPLAESVLTYCQLDSWEQISMKKFESEFYNFHSNKCIWKCCLPKWRPFCLGLNMLTHPYDLLWVVLITLRGWGQVRILYKVIIWQKNDLSDTNNGECQTITMVTSHFAVINHWSVGGVSKMYMSSYI